MNSELNHESCEPSKKCQMSWNKEAANHLISQNARCDTNAYCKKQ